MTDNGVAWTSPSGRHYPPKSSDSQAPVYTKWLRKFIDRSLCIQYLTEDLYGGDSNESVYVENCQDEQWDDDIIPEPSAGTFPSDEDNEILTQIAIENYLLEHASGEPSTDYSVTLEQSPQNVPAKLHTSPIDLSVHVSRGTLIRYSVILPLRVEDQLDLIPVPAHQTLPDGLSTMAPQQPSGPVLRCQGHTHAVPGISSAPGFALSA